MKRKLFLVLVCSLVLNLAEGGTGIHLRSRSMVTAGRRKWVQDEIVVKFKKGVSKDRINRINRRQGAYVLHTSAFADFKRIKVPVGKTPQQLVRLYSREPHVEYAELNYYAHALWVPNDPLYVQGYQWHFDNADYGGINMESAWDITTGEPNVVIAVVDTGVAYENYRGFEVAPDLADTLFVAGYNFVSDNEHANDDDGHGTHVTGTIAQSTNNNLGPAGIAFNCSVMPVKVLNRRGDAPYTTVAEGVYFAADNGADIINLSLGGPYDDNTLRNAVAYAYAKGVIIICAAGNEFLYDNAPHYPAAYDDYCIAVGATQYDQSRSPYSNTGTYIDLVAPGGNMDENQSGNGYDGVVQQTFGTSPKDWGYWFYEGTSMAAAHVSAVAALLISNGEDRQEVRHILETTATDLGPAGWDEEYGWGIIDAYAALNYCSIIGDFNGDCRVDIEDLAALAAVWLKDAPLMDIAPVGGDHIINFLDFAELAGKME